MRDLGSADVGFANDQQLAAKSVAALPGCALRGLRVQIHRFLRLHRGSLGKLRGPLPQAF